jgi:PAS domain S-box-containing protein
MTWEMDDLKKEIDELRQKNHELQETLDAIRSGEVDAIVISKGEDQQVYTLEGTDHPYRALIENIQEGALTLTTTGLILYCNLRFAEIVQLPPEKVPGTSILDYICKDYRRKIEFALVDVISQPSRNQVRIRQGSSSIPVFLSMNALSPDKKSKISVVITDRRKDQDKIHMQALMLDSVGDAVIAVDIHQKIIYWNDAATKIYGWKREEGIGRDICEIMSHDISTILSLDSESDTPHRDSWSGNLVVSHQDGHKFPIYASFSPVLNKNGEFVAYIGVSYDLTEQKRAEEMLRESEKTAHAILSAVKESIWLFSAEGIILTANQTALERLGSKKIDEVIGHRFEEFMSSELARKRRDRLDDVIRSCQPLSFEDERDGIIFDHTFYPILNTAGSVKNIVVFSQDITERKRNENMLKESEERFRSVLENSRDIIYQVNIKTGQYGYISPSVKTVMGLSPEEVIEYDPETAFSMIHPDDRQLVRETFARLEHIHSVDVQYRQRNKAGDYRWLSNHISTIKDSNGDLLYRIGNIRDITSKILAEEALRESESLTRSSLEKLNHVMNSVPAAIWIAHDSEALHITGNMLSYEWLNLPYGSESSKSAPEGKKTETFRMLKDGRELESCEMPVQLAARGREIKNYEFDFLYPNGNIRSVLGNASPIFNQNGKPSGSIASFIDISSRKQMEKTLAESEEQYRTLFNTMIEGFCIIEVLFDDNEKPIDYRFLEINPAFERETGIRNAKGKLIRDLIPDNEEHWYEVYGRIARTGEAERFENETKALHRWYDVSAFRVGGRNSRRVGILFNDITKRKQMEEDLNCRYIDLMEAYQEISSIQEDLRKNIEELSTREQQLSHALAEKEVLLREIYHRVKNNLATIISLINLQMATLSSDSDKMHFQDLEARIRSMVLVHETLYRTKNFSEISMDSYIKSLIQYLFGIYNLHQEIELQFNLEPVKLPIDTAIPCGLVVNEIITNALKYAYPPYFSCEQERGCPCTISTAIKVDGDNLILRITDNGIGMAIDAIDQKQNIGVSLVKFIVPHQLRGTVVISSIGGTEYLIDIPLVHRE